MQQFSPLGMYRKHTAVAMLFRHTLVTVCDLLAGCPEVAHFELLNAHKQARPLADWTDCFQSGPAPKGSRAALTNLGKITLSIEVACAVQSRCPQFFLSIGPVATEITFNCGAYYTQYLISGGTECSNSWIYCVLRRCLWMSLLERWNWCHAPNLPGLASPFQASLCHINDFYQYDWMHRSKLSAHATEWGPAKVLPIVPRTC